MNTRLISVSEKVYSYFYFRFTGFYFGKAFSGFAVSRKGVSV
jgi:hypothetical protein